MSASAAMDEVLDAAQEIVGRLVERPYDTAPLARKMYDSIKAWEQEPNGGTALRACWDAIEYIDYQRGRPESFPQEARLWDAAQAYKAARKVGS